MKVSTKLNRDELHIYLDGELDHSVAEEIRTQIDDYIEKNAPAKVILEMGKLKFMDSTGIGFILGRYKKLRSKHIPMFIGSPNPQIDKVIKISGLYSIIPLLR